MIVRERVERLDQQAAISSFGVHIAQRAQGHASAGFEEVWNEASEHNVSLRTAAFMIAIRRVKRATELSGI